MTKKQTIEKQKNLNLLKTMPFEVQNTEQQYNFIPADNEEN
jgi:hypothetical protein